LDYYYPINGTCLRENEGWQLNNFGKRRENIEKLDISNQNLAGSLELVGFVNLAELHCSYNQLTEIILPVENKIERLTCWGNPNLKSWFFTSTSSWTND